MRLLGGHPAPDASPPGFPACAADHTTLLLNCYTKLKNVDKLDAFVHKERAPGADGEAVPNFDLETAYKVGCAAVACYMPAGGRWCSAVLPGIA